MASFLIRLRGKPILYMYLPFIVFAIVHNIPLMFYVELLTLNVACGWYGVVLDVLFV